MANVEIYKRLFFARVRSVQAIVTDRQKHTGTPTLTEMKKPIGIGEISHICLKIFNVMLLSMNNNRNSFRASGLPFQFLFVIPVFFF